MGRGKRSVVVQGQAIEGESNVDSHIMHIIR